MALSCPINSVAPVLAITGMAATDVDYDNSFDPVGETLKPIAAGPSLVHFPEREEDEDGDRQKESRAEERAGAAVCNRRTRGWR
jgi:hypothetical protein